MDDLVDDEPLAERLRNGDDLRSRIEAADRIEKLEAVLEAVKERCFSASGEDNWSHDILSIIVPVLEVRATITSSAR